MYYTVVYYKILQCNTRNWIEHMPKLKTILKKEKIQHFDQDLRSMSQAQLAKHFGATHSGRIMLTGLIKNIIWQAYERTRPVPNRPSRGISAPFGYLWVKPVLSHMTGDDNVRTKPYSTMLKAFTNMVMDLRLFRYADFDFTDENWENRRIGKTHPEVVVFRIEHHNAQRLKAIISISTLLVLNQMILPLQTSPFLF